MAQQPIHGTATPPLPDLRQLQAFHLQLERDTAALQAEEAALKGYWTHWFPARQQMHWATYHMQVAQMHAESEDRRRSALLWNITYIVSGRGQPRSTGYQEELFLRRSEVMQWQQCLRNIEGDRSTLERMKAQLELKRARIGSDWRWLQHQYQPQGYTLAIPPIP